MELEELKTVFRNVHEAMEDDGGIFFDLNLEDESEMLAGSLDMVEDDHVFVVCASYKPKRN